MPYFKCCMSGCKTRIKVSERRRIGQAHFYPYFVAFVGEAVQSYDKDSDICKSCHAKVMTSRRTDPIEIPGKRSYQTVLSESSVDEPLSKTRRGLTYGVELLGRTGASSLGDENVGHVNEAYDFSESDPRSIIDTFRPPKETRPRTDEGKQFQSTEYRSQLEYCSESSESSMELSASAGFFGHRHRTTEAIGSSAVRQSVLLESSSSSEGLSQLSSRDLSQHSVFSGYNFRLYRNPPSVESQNNSSTSHSESSILSSQASLPPSNATPQSLISNTSMNTYSQASFFSSTTQSERDYEDDDCVHLLNVQACSYSESCCVVCQSESGRSRIPSTAFNQVYREKNIFIPPGNRTCEHHLLGKLFTSSALERIVARMSTVSVPKDKFSKWLGMTFSVPRGVSHGPLDFSTAELDDDTCLTLLGVIGKDLLCIYSHISSEMRISNNRHPINSLAMLLILLRLNISQDAVGKLFGLTQRLVSDNVSTVAKLLDRKFVSENLGFSHMPFEKVITSQNRKTFTTALVIPEDSLVLIQDGTYVYVEKSMDHAKQRETYSGQKKRNFIKPMMTVLPSGYILDVQGPFSAVSNDASILNLMLHPQHTSGFYDYVQKSSNPHLILDRGFRDSKDAAREAFVEIRMPKFLNNACQFTVRESNESRVVTFLRWVVEVANGRIKRKFKFLGGTVPGGYSEECIMRFFRVSAAILNKFAKPIFSESDDHIQRAEAVLSRVKNRNRLKERISRLRLEQFQPNWIRASHDIVTDFPALTSEDLKTITLGHYQLEVAKSYIKEHLKANGDFEIFIHQEMPNLIRAKIHSRFQMNHHHSVWVQFDSNGVGADSISGWYCKCKNGARTVGCCSHVATIIRFFGHDRNCPTVSVRSRAKSTLINAVMELKRLNEASAVVNEDEVDDEGEVED